MTATPQAIVTGAPGFIGRRLVARLRADGARVRAVALPGEDASMLGDAEVVRADVTDAAAVRAAITAGATVYHLAAMVGDWGPEEAFAAVNVGGTRNVLDAAAAAGAQRVVMVSSIVVYGSQLLEARDLDARSGAREWGVSGYSRTKRASEELAFDYHAFGRVPVTVVRPGNVYGPGSVNWVDLPVAMLRSGAMPLIDGGDGDASLAYVDNVVDVIARAGTTAAAAGRIYDALDGSGVTWRQYFTDLARLAGVRPPRRTISRAIAMAGAAAMERAWRLARRKTRPMLTREAVTLVASRAHISIIPAADDLGYQPLVPYAEALEHIGAYLEGTSQ